MTSSDRLPESFLRGLEADLRALCTDARRKNPEVKEAAERVILSLKEANSAQLEIVAADNAAEAFCAACEPPPASSSSSLSSYIKVVLRAVTSVHKLLTHRAVSEGRLPQILDALHRLALSCVDDTVTLKVLQGLLSLLTVRSYAKSLSEEDLSRAFSLLFVLKTSRSRSANNPASNALSAISHISISPDSGVIEQTSKAAFRQASSDLFASAADAAVQTAVRLEVPSGEFIPIDVFPTEARASYRFFVDLCHAASGIPMTWLSHVSTRSDSSAPDIDLTLALEVIDDGLASNVGLFAAQPVFLDLVSKQLCPVIHKLLPSSLERSQSKSLFALLVTVIRHYWRNILPESQKLLEALVNVCRVTSKSGGDTISWSVVYAMEALRSIFHTEGSEPNIIIDFVRVLELGDHPTESISMVTKVACSAMEMLVWDKPFLIPPNPITGSLKPFAKNITNSTNFYAALATGLYLDIVNAAKEAVEKESQEVAKKLLHLDVTTEAVDVISKLIQFNPFPASQSASHLSDLDVAHPIDILSKALASITTVAHVCDLDDIRLQAFSTLCSTCAATARNGAEGGSEFAKRVKSLYTILFNVVSMCQQSLGRSWSLAVDAFDDLDSLICKVDLAGEKKTSALLITNTKLLRQQLEGVYKATRNMKWEACYDMISAFVHSSRQSVAQLSKRMPSDELSKSEMDQNLRVFGIFAAETAILNLFQRASEEEDPMPLAIWELLTGHLTSVCADSSFRMLRMYALNSLTLIACSAIPSTETTIVPHEKIITPFLDLFNSKHTDVRSGSLASINTILESRGERLKGESAWKVILSILTKATGSKTSAKGNDLLNNSEDSFNPGTGQKVTSNTTQGNERISEGFKVVQVIANDFLPSLAQNSLSSWLEVISLYCRQEDDINVALTSIGLLWRTADFLAKRNDIRTEDLLWVEVFEILKDVSMDERPEIRNCAVKTLTGALTAHTSQLSARAWSGCTERALLPLLEEVMKGGAYANQNNEGAAGGGRGRNDSQVMWHHSRDTPRKQWNETRVLALGGVAKVLRSAMSRLAMLRYEDGRPLFLLLTDGGPNGLWQKMLRSAAVASASRDREVAMAGVSALLELLKAAGFVVNNKADHDPPMLQSSTSAPATIGLASGNGDSGSLAWIDGMIVDSSTREKVDDQSSQHGDSTPENGTVALWEAVWTALTASIGGEELLQQENHHARAEPEMKIVDEKALQLLAEGLLESKHNFADKFTSSSSRMLVKALIRLAAGHGYEEQIKDGDDIRDELTEVQEVTLNGLKNLSFGNDVESWTEFLEGLLNSLTERSYGLERSVVYTRRVLNTVHAIYSDEEMPHSVKSNQLQNVLPVLGRVMSQRQYLRKGTRTYDFRRSSDGRNDLDDENNYHHWKLGCDIFITLMKYAKGRTLVGINLSDEWNVCANSLDSFLYNEHGVRGELGQIDHEFIESSEVEMYDMRLVACVAECLQCMGTETEIKTKEKLVRIISRGAEGQKSGRRRFVRMCQKTLFLFILRDLKTSIGNSSKQRVDETIVEQCGRHVVKTCTRVLGQFIADGRRAGRCPLPAGRRAEAVFLLRQLRQILLIDTDKTSENGSRKWVLALYPQLCECVKSRDEAIWLLAREVLDEAAPLMHKFDSGLEVNGTARSQTPL